MALAAACHDDTLPAGLQGLMAMRAGFSSAGTAATGLPMAARRGASSFLVTCGWMTAAASAGFCRQVRRTG